MRRRLLFGVLVLAILSASMVSMAAPVYKVALVAPFTGYGSIIGE